MCWRLFHPEKTRRAGTFVLPCVILLTTACGGCMGRAISEGLGLATGPKGVVMPLKPISHAKNDHALASYTNFELQPFTDNFGGLAPREITWRLGPAFHHELAEKNIRSRRGGKTLLIRGEIWHYETASLVGHAFGPLEELCARVYFIDKTTGKTLGVYNCIGRSTQSVNQGLDKKIEGLAEAIVNTIARHYPVPPK